jgi:hypothetical protein
VQQASVIVVGPLSTIAVVVPASIVAALPASTRGIIGAGRQLRIIAPAPPPAAAHTSPGVGQSAAVAQTTRPAVHVPASVAWHAAPPPAAVQQTIPAPQLPAVHGGVPQVISPPAPMLHVWPDGQSAVAPQTSTDPIGHVAAHVFPPGAMPLPPAIPVQHTWPAAQLAGPVHGGVTHTRAPPRSSHV